MRKIPLKAIRNNTPSVKAYVKAVKGQYAVLKKSNSKVKKATTNKATKQFSTQKEALDYAREIAHKQQAELFINGNRKPNSLKKDSFPPKG